MLSNNFQSGREKQLKHLGTVIKRRDYITFVHFNQRLALCVLEISGNETN